MSIILDALKKAKGASTSDDATTSPVGDPALVDPSVFVNSSEQPQKAPKGKSDSVKRVGFFVVMFLVGVFAALLFRKNFFGGARVVIQPAPLPVVASAPVTPSTTPVAPLSVAPKQNLSVVADGTSSGVSFQSETSKAVSPEEAQLREGVLQSANDQDWETAVTQYEQILVLNALDPEIYNNYGVALRKTGQNEKSKAAYLQALALDPNYAEAMNNLAVVLMAKNEYALAKRVLVKAIELQPDYIDPYLHMAIALEKNGELEAAREYYQTFLRISEKKADRRVRLQVEERLSQLKDRF